MAGDNNLDSPETTTVAATAATGQSPEGTSDEKKKLLEEEKANELNRPANNEVSSAGTYVVIDVDEEIHLLDWSRVHIVNFGQNYVITGVTFVHFSIRK